MKNYVEEYLTTWEMFAKYFTQKEVLKILYTKRWPLDFFHPVISFDTRWTLL